MFRWMKILARRFLSITTSLSFSKQKILFVIRLGILFCQYAELSQSISLHRTNLHGIIAGNDPAILNLNIRGWMSEFAFRI